MFSGIHLNYSFADEMLKEGYQVLLARKEKNGSKPPVSTYQSYKNDLYLQLAQKTILYSWFIVYLTAASPVMDASFLFSFADSGHEIWKEEDLTGYASARCGELGYWNDFTPVFNYQNLETYIQSIESYVQYGQLRSVSELYYPVRLKPRGENSLKHLKEKGINHIELRMLDVNPLSPIGLMKEDIEFLHYFMLYLLGQENMELMKEEQINAIVNEKQAAKFDDSKIFIRESDGNSKPVRQAALETLQDMEVFYVSVGEGTALESIRHQKDKLLMPGNRYADRIRAAYGRDYVKRGICLADEYAKELLVNQTGT